MTSSAHFLLIKSTTFTLLFLTTLSARRAASWVVDIACNHHPAVILLQYLGKSLLVTTANLLEIERESTYELPVQVNHSMIYLLQLVSTVSECPKAGCEAGTRADEIASSWDPFTDAWEK